MPRLVSSRIAAPFQTGMTDDAEIMQGARDVLLYTAERAGESSLVSFTGAKVDLRGRYGA